MRVLFTAAASAALLALCTAARADPPFDAGSEVIDPWAPAAQPTTWSGPSGDELIDPWSGRSAAPVPDDACVVDPWKHERARAPTRILPAPEILDPWARSH